MTGMVFMHQSAPLACRSRRELGNQVLLYSKLAAFRRDRVQVKQETQLIDSKRHNASAGPNVCDF
jgi:hypothetical protein